jgi:hypothetical protein
MELVEVFVGRYYNCVNTWCLDIFLEQDGTGGGAMLYVSRDAHHRDKWPLHHYRYDVLT